VVSGLGFNGCLSVPLEQLVHGGGDMGRRSFGVWRIET
jgi:hypothetical protein